MTHAEEPCQVAEGLVGALTRTHNLGGQPRAPSDYAYRVKMKRTQTLGHRTWTQTKTIPLATAQRIGSLRAHWNQCAPWERWEFRVQRIPLGLCGSWEPVDMDMPLRHDRGCDVSLAWGSPELYRKAVCDCGAQDRHEQEVQSWR